MRRVISFLCANFGNYAELSISMRATFFLSFVLSWRGQLDQLLLTSLQLGSILLGSILLHSYLTHTHSHYLVNTNTHTHTLSAVAVFGFAVFFLVGDFFCFIFKN